MDPSQSVSPRANVRDAWKPAPAAKPQPYGVALEPGAVLNESFRVWSSDFLRQVGVLATPYAMLIGFCVVGAVAGAFSGAFDTDPSLAVLAVLGTLGLVAVGLTLGTFVAAQAGAFLTLEESARGEPRSLSVLGAIGAGWPHFKNLAGAYLLTALAACVALTPGALLLVAGIEGEMVGLSVGGGLLELTALVAVLFFAFRLMPMAPAIVIEDLSPLAGIRRSFELTSGKVSSIFLCSFVFGLVLFAINAGVGILGLVPFLGPLVQLVFAIVLGALQTAFAFTMYGALSDASAES